MAVRASEPQEATADDVRGALGAAPQAVEPSATGVATADDVRSALAVAPSPTTVAPAPTTSADTPAKQEPVKPLARGGARKAVDTFFEALLQARPGTVTAASRLANVPDDDPIFRIPIPFTDSEFSSTPALKYTFSGLTGEHPSFDDFEALAKQDADFAKFWRPLASSVSASENIARQLWGDDPQSVDWNAVLGNYVRSRADDAELRGEMPPPPTDDPEVFDPLLQMGDPVLAQGQRDGTSPLERVLYSGVRPQLLRPPDGSKPTLVLMRDPLTMKMQEFWSDGVNGQPGVTRPPVSKQEAARYAWEALIAAEAESQGTLPAPLTPLLRGAANATLLLPVEVASLAAAALPGAKALAGSAFARKFAQSAAASVANLTARGALFSAERQGLAVATGAQPTFDLGQLLLDSAMMGGSGAVADKFGEALALGPKARGAMTLVGQNALQTAHQMILQGGMSQEMKDHPVRESIGWIAENAAMMAVGSLIGVLPKYGRKGTSEIPEEIRLKPLTGSGGGTQAIKAKDAYDATAVTYDALATSIGTLAEKFGMARRSAQPSKNAIAIADDLLPLTMEGAEAARQLIRFRDSKAGGDPAKAKLIERLLWDEVEGRGEYSPSPQLRSVLSDADRAIGVQLQQKLATTTLELGRRMRDHNILPEARVRPKGGGPDAEDRVIFKRDLDADPDLAAKLERGDLGEIVGSFRYHDARGGFTPHFLAQKGKGDEAAYRKPKAMPRGHLSGKDVREHLSARELTAGEKLSEAPSIGLRALELDRSPERAIDLFRDNVDALRSKMQYDMLAEQGFLMKRLPSTPERDVAGAQIADLGNQLHAARAAYKASKNPAERRVLAEKMSAMIRLRSELQNVAEADAGFTKLSGKEYGDYDGWYLNRSAYPDVRAMARERSGWEAFAGELTSFIKMNQVGLNPSLALIDAIGNAKMFGDAGIDLTPRWADALKLVGSRRLGSGVKTHRFAEEFFEQARKDSFGGQTEAASADVAELSKLSKEKARAKKQGRSTAGFTAAEGVQKVVQAVHTLPGLKGLSIGRRALVDEAAALAGYMVAREKGVGGSGPMRPVEAFEYVRGIAGSSTLPATVHAAAKGASYLRWRATVVRNLATRTLLRKPSLYGQNIPTPFDYFIEKKPGSPAAQASLVARGLMRVALQGAQWVSPLWATQHALLQEQGISKQAFDEYLDERFRELPDAARWLIKSTAIPLGRTSAGRMEFIDGSQAFPELAALRYFWLGTRAGDSFAMNLLNKNVFAPFIRAPFGLDDRGHMAESGFAPGQAGWPMVSALTPALVSQPAAQIAREMKAPEGERDYGRAIARSIMGVPISVVDLPNPFRKSIDRWIGEGILGVEERDDGTSNLYVRTPKPEELTGDLIAKYQQAQIDLKLFKRVREMMPYPALTEAIDRIDSALTNAAIR